MKTMTDSLKRMAKALRAEGIKLSVRRIKPIPTTNWRKEVHHDPTELVIHGLDLRISFYDFGYTFEAPHGLCWTIPSSREVERSVIKNTVVNVKSWLSGQPIEPL